MQWTDIRRRALVALVGLAAFGLLADLFRWIDIHHNAAVASYWAQVGILFVALVGLLQLYLSRQATQLQCDRDAIRIAAEMSQRFADQILPNLGHRLTILERAQVQVKTGVLKNTDFDDTSIEWTAEIESLVQRAAADTTLLNAIAGILNPLEAFAIFFAQGLASEEAAFSAVGPLFCYYVEAFSPFIIRFRQGRIAVASGGYDNAIAMYRCWSPRITKLEKQREVRQLTEEIESLEEQPISYISPHQNRAQRRAQSRHRRGKA